MPSHTHSRPTHYKLLQRLYFSAHWFVLIGALGLTLFAWLLTSHLYEAEARKEFATRSQQLAATITSHMATYAQILQGAAGLFAASVTVERGEWHAYVVAQKLDEHYPGVLALAFAAYLPPDQLAAHEREVRAEGFPNYSVWPRGKREEYSSIVYIEPFFGRNLRAFGYDMLSESTRHEAMERARRTGAPALSGKVRLVQENGSTVQAGALLYLPVYRNGASLTHEASRREALLGWVYQPYRMDDLMHGLLPLGSMDLDIELYDGELQREQLLYPAEPSSASTQPPRFSEVISLPLYGRQWLLQVKSTPAFELQVASNLPQLVALSGSLISLLCFALTLSVVRTRSHAIHIAEDMTVRLSQSERRYRQMFESNQSIMLLVNPADGSIVDANGAAISFYGYTRTTLLTMRLADISTLPAEQLRQALDECSQHACVHSDLVHRLANGNLCAVEAYSGPIEVEGRKLLFLIIHDISQRRQAERKVALLTDLIELSADPVYIISPAQDFRLVFVNDAACRHWGWSREQLQRMSVWDWDNNFNRDNLTDLWARLMQEKSFRIETEHRTAAGGHIPVEVSINYLQHDEEELIAGYFHDISQRKANEARTTHQAQHDTLTDLPNRSLFTDRLRQALAQARRNKSRVALMFIDLDNFKPVNDKLGHHVGDLLLKQVASRLTDCVRESDTLARLGGDEFVVLLPPAEQIQDAEVVARKILSELARPFEVADHALQISASIGIAFYPEHAENDRGLMEHADAAMYQAKRGGRNRYCIYAADFAQPEPGSP